MQTIFYNLWKWILLPQFLSLKMKKKKKVRKKKNEKRKEKKVILFKSIVDTRFNHAFIDEFEKYPC